MFLCISLLLLEPMHALLLEPMHALLLEPMHALPCIVCSALNKKDHGTDKTVYCTVHLT